MSYQSKISYCYSPTIESLQKLQNILTKILNREVSLEEAESAYHPLMGYALALIDLLPNPSSLYKE